MEYLPEAYQECRLRIPAYNGLIPSRPANRRLQSSTANAVEPIKITRARFLNTECQPPCWDISRYQPLPSISKVRPRNGQLSARNAGTVASPAEVPPRKPSRPGTTHHQGSGKSPLSVATNSFSTCNNLRRVHKALLLFRWAPDVSIRAEDAAVALVGPQD